MFNPLANKDDKDEKRDPFGRIMPEQKPEPVLQNLGNSADLNESVGEIGKNKRRDVAKVESMLGKAKTLDLKKTDGPTGYWGERTRIATRDFQKKHGLKVDGQINPGGETVKKLAEVTHVYPKPAPAPQQTTAPQGKSEQLSIGIWPQGDDVPSRQPVEKKPDNAELADTATDDETSVDDNLKFKRNMEDSILKHLIEGGMEGEDAKAFTDMLLKDRVIIGNENGPVKTGLRGVSSWMLRQLAIPENIITSFIEGPRE